MADQVARLKAALADRYAIERELGRGGMATVYLARDLRHGRPVAIKVLRPEIAAALGPERFLREIEVAARLTHPHILPPHDSGEAAGFLYYVMPYIEGESLRQRRSGSSGAYKPSRLPISVFIGRGVAGDRRDTGSVRVHDEQIRISISQGGEQDLGPVPRPRRELVERGIVGQTHQVGTVRVDHADLEIRRAVGIAVERDPRPVRRPRRGIVHGAVARESRRVRPVRVHDVDLIVAVAIAHERELRAIGRPRRPDEIYVMNADGTKI